MTTMFAIRNVHTGHFLPFTKKGYTTVEPMDIKECPPRLLLSYRGACQALAAWCKGVYRASWEYPDCEYGPGGAYVSDIQITPKPRRNKDDFEIVSVYMHMEPVKK